MWGWPRAQTLSDAEPPLPASPAQHPRRTRAPAFSWVRRPVGAASVDADRSHVARRERKHGRAERLSAAPRPRVPRGHRTYAATKGKQANSLSTAAVWALDSGRSGVSTASSRRCG